MSADVYVQLFDVAVYRHDDMYYTGSYEYNLRSEGRWINYLLYDGLKLIPGWLAVLSILLFFTVFAFSIAYRRSGDVLYSLLLSLLMVQSYPIYLQILWPATSVPAFVVLVIAAIVYVRLNVWLFYALFGVLCFGTLSNVYYILPLLGLQCTGNDAQDSDVKNILSRTIPAWAMGFMLGYLVMLAVVYLLAGQWGIELADWRKPNVAHGIADLVANFDKSANALRFHLINLFSDWARVAIIVAALVFRLFWGHREYFYPVVLVSIAVVLAHYIIVIPVGIQYATRTALATWVGIVCAVFVISRREGTKMLWAAPLVVWLTFSFAKQNASALEWYATITNYWLSEIVRSTPLTPAQYRGLVFLSEDTEVGNSVKAIAARYMLQQGVGFERLDRSKSWKPVAFEAGFKSVILCGEAQTQFCTETRRKYDGTPPGGDKLYYFPGVTNDGFLVVRLNSDWIPM